MREASPADPTLDTDEQQADSEESPPDDDHAQSPPAVVVAGLGLAATGIVATLDRLRRAQLRRRPPGRRIQLPKGEEAATELRIRGLADPESRDALTHALESLAAACHARGDALPEVVLVSISPGDVGVHLADADPDPPGEWQSADDGITWVLAREHITPTDAAGNWSDSPPILFTIGTTAGGHRRVLLNLAHAGTLGIDADPGVRRQAMLSFAVELTTTADVGFSNQVVLVGFGQDLDALEFITHTDDADEAIDLIEKHASYKELPVVALFDQPLDHDSRRRLEQVVADSEGFAGAVLPADDTTTWKLTDDDGTWRLSPHDIELAPLELTETELEQVGRLVRLAKHRHYTPPLDDDVAPDPTVEDEDEDQPSILEVVSRDPNRYEVQVLGPVHISGIQRFPAAKTCELVTLLALRRAGVETDALMEALWPNQEPNRNRVQTEISRARELLGAAPNGEPYLPKADHGVYRLSPQCTLDYERFDQLVAISDQRPADAMPALRAALELVRGRPFAVTHGEYAWITPYVHAITPSIIDTAVKLAEMYLEADDPVGATTAANKGLDADEYSEALYRVLMRAGHQAGDPGQVRRAMSRLRGVVADDATANDVDDWLDPETLRLYNDLMRRRHPHPTELRQRWRTTLWRHGQHCGALMGACAQAVGRRKCQQAGLGDARTSTVGRDAYRSRCL